MPFALSIPQPAQACPPYSLEQHSIRALTRKQPQEPAATQLRKVGLPPGEQAYVRVHPGGDHSPTCHAKRARRIDRHPVDLLVGIGTAVVLIEHCQPPRRALPHVRRSESAFKRHVCAPREIGRAHV